MRCWWYCVTRFKIDQAPCDGTLPQVMTNMRPKSYFLRPDVALPLALATVREFFHQYVRQRPTAYPSAKDVKAAATRK